MSESKPEKQNRFCVQPCKVQHNGLESTVYMIRDLTVYATEAQANDACGALNASQKLLDQAIVQLMIIEPVLKKCIESKVMPMASAAYQPAKDIAAILVKHRLTWRDG